MSKEVIKLSLGLQCLNEKHWVLQSNQISTLFLVAFHAKQWMQDNLLGYTDNTWWRKGTFFQEPVFPLPPFLSIVDQNNPHLIFLNTYTLFLLLRGVGLCCSKSPPIRLPCGVCLLIFSSETSCVPLWMGMTFVLGLFLGHSENQSSPNCCLTHMVPIPHWRGIWNTGRRGQYWLPFLILYWVSINHH